MPLPYFWLFAFLIPLSCSVSILSQGPVTDTTHSEHENQDPHLGV
jgi:hypothetical protein